MAYSQQTQSQNFWGKYKSKNFFSEEQETLLGTGLYSVNKWKSTISGEGQAALELPKTSHRNKEVYLP